MNRLAHPTEISRTPRAAALETDPGLDAPGVARTARSEAGAIPEASTALRVVVTGSPTQVATLDVTPDTPVHEILDAACAELGVPDPERYRLIAAGVFLHDGDTPVGDLTGVGTRLLPMRMVRVAEAGRAAAAA